MAATGTVQPLGVRERWLTTGILGVGLIIFAINASTTNLIVPQIMTNLRVELYQIHWVLTANGIARAVVVPVMGWASAHWGPRTLYLLAIGTFCLGTLGSALAWDWTSLIISRVLTGAGGGLLVPLATAIFYQIFPPGQRGLALGLSLIGWSIGPSIGPLMGGYLLEYTSWRAIYTMILPFGVMGFILAWWCLPPLRRPPRRRLDQAGLGLMATAVISLLLALSQGNREGWDSSYILTLFTIAGIASIIFVVVELCHPEPLVELRLFRSFPFVMAVVVLFLTTVAFRGTGPMMTVLMQQALGFVPLLVAWTLLPANLIYGLSVLVVGRLSDRFSSQHLVIIGLLMYAGAFIGYAGINELTTATMMMVFLSVRFTAEGFIVSPNNKTALQALPDDQVMMASGLIGLVRSIANTVGTALSAVFWDDRYGHYMRYYGAHLPPDAPGLSPIVSSLQHLLRAAGEIPAQIPGKSMALLHRQLLAEASTAAWQDYFLLNAFLALVSIIPALLVKIPPWESPPSALPVTPQASATVDDKPPAGATGRTPRATGGGDSARR